MSDRELIDRLHYYGEVTESCKENPTRKIVRQAANALEQADALNAQQAARIKELVAYNATRTDELLASVKQAAALAAQLVQMVTALEMAKNGIVWYVENSSDANGCDDDAVAEIDAALALSTKPASEVLAEHDAKVIERCLPDRRPFRAQGCANDEPKTTPLGRYMFRVGWNACRALIAAPKENSNVPK